MTFLSKACAAALLAAALGGCQALGGGGGVMPETEVGPPPSMRGTVPGSSARNAGVDEDGRPLQTAPTRRLDLPKSAGGQTRASAAEERRIRREDIEGGSESRGASGGLSPTVSPGGVGVGGKF